jgi:hypothetical protein
MNFCKSCKVLVPQQAVIEPPRTPFGCTYDLPHLSHVRFVEAGERHAGHLRYMHPKKPVSGGPPAENIVERDVPKIFYKVIIDRKFGRFLPRIVATKLEEPRDQVSVPYYRAPRDQFQSQSVFR